MFDDPEWQTAPDFEDVERRRVYWEMLLKAVRSRRLAQWQEIFDADPNVRGKLYRHGHELLDHPQMFFDDWVVASSTTSTAPCVSWRRWSRCRRHRQPSALHLDATPTTRARDAPESRGAGSRRSVSPRTAPRGRHDRGALLVLRRTVRGHAVNRPRRTRDQARAGHSRSAALHVARVPRSRCHQGVAGKAERRGGFGDTRGTLDRVNVVSHADFVLQSFRAGAAERLLLDHETLLAINPDLIYLTAPGYGPVGPSAIVRPTRPLSAPGRASAGATRRLDRRAGRHDLGLGEVQRATPLGLVVGVGARAVPPL